MSQITRKWIADNAVNREKIDDADIYTVAGLNATVPLTGGHLAVDTTAPRDALHIRGTADGSVGLRIDFDGASGRSYQIMSTSDGSMVFKDADLALSVDPRMIIGPTGIVRTPGLFHSDTGVNTVSINATSITTSSIITPLVNSATNASYQVGTDSNSMSFGTASDTFLTLSRYLDIGIMAYARHLELSSSSTDYAYLTISAPTTDPYLYLKKGVTNEVYLRGALNSMSLASWGDSTFISNYAGGGSTDKFFFRNSTSTFLTLSRYLDTGLPGPYYYARHLELSSSGTDYAYLTISAPISDPYLYLKKGSTNEVYLRGALDSMSLASWGDSTFISNYQGGGSSDKFFFRNSTSTFLTLSRYLDTGLPGPYYYARHLELSSSGTDYAYLTISAPISDPYLYLKKGVTNEVYLRGALNSMSLASGGDSTFISNYQGGGSTDKFFFRNSTSTFLTLSRFYDTGIFAYARHLELSSSGTDYVYLTISAPISDPYLYLKKGSINEVYLRGTINSMSLGSWGDSTFISNYQGGGSTGIFRFNKGGQELMSLSNETSSLTNLQINSFSADDCGITINSAVGNSLLIFSTGGSPGGSIQWFSTSNTMILYGNTVRINSLAGSGSRTVVVDSNGNLSAP